MLFVLAGPSYVGKKTALSHFMKLYSFSSIIPYTTKPVERRIGEVEGIKYHYVANEDSQDIKNDFYIWDTPFQCDEQQDSVLYAYKKTDIKNAIDSYANFIIHASVGNAIKIYDEYHEKNQGHLYVFFLDFRKKLSKDFFKEKYEGMGAPGSTEGTKDLVLDDPEFMRRFHHAQKEEAVYRENTNKFDGLVKADHKYEMCEELEKVILPKLMVMPTSPDRIPGPLSDVDILYMSEKRKIDKLEVSVAGGKLQESELKKKLFGCGMQLTLSSTIRLVKKNLVHNYIDMASSETEIESQLAKLYPEENISTGYILRPNETILCTSEEKIKMPNDVYAIVASKFSYTQLGLSIELGTSIIQAGHFGRVHFQIKNNTESSICIYPHIQVVQLLFFRTVQPSSQKYSEDTTTHSYDSDSVPPVSKFRKDNTGLVDVEKPKDNFLKSILANSKAKVMTEIVGAIFVIIIMVFNWQRMEECIDTYFFPLFNKSSSVIKCFIIAVIGCILSNLFLLMGKLVFWFGKRLLAFYRKETR